MKLFFYFLLISGSFVSVAQEFTLSGTVQSASDNSTFPGATVTALSPVDSSLVKGAISDFNGDFSITGLIKGKYLIKVNFVGFQPIMLSVNLERNTALGSISLKEETKLLNAIEVIGRPVAAMQKGDTSQFSAASYKTAPDASSQELIEKLPGITLEDGKIQANGEDVQVILVDGKPFFGGDVNAALQNLPAEVVAQIQIFDKKSDKAALSGFDDGEQQKTINIITKPSKRKGQFGKSTVGLGTNDTYHAGASINFFNNDRRITVTGLSNNINTINYSPDPNSMGDSRTQNGLIKTNNLGINFSDDVGKRVEVHGNYRFSNQENTEQQNTLRDFTINADSGQVYKENRSYFRNNTNHNFNLKFQYKDDQNTILMRPHVSFRHENTTNDFIGQTDSEGDLINTTVNMADGKYQDYDYNNDLFYSRKFVKKGRSFTSKVRTGYHTNEDLSNRYAENYFYAESDSVNIIDQETTRARSGISWEVGTSYTEPVGKNSLMEVQYEIGDRIDDSDKLTYDVDEVNDQLTIDTSLSNTFKSKYLQQKLELGYQYRTESLRVQVGTEFQSTGMKNDQEFPYSFNQQRTFRSILPSARLNYQISDDNRIEVDYRTRTSEPSIGQLQQVIDNSNPLRLQSGNPDLQQTYYHNSRLRFWSNNFDTEKSIYASFHSSFAKNIITNASIIADEQQEIEEGVILEKGSQYTFPVNVDGFFNLRYYMSYGQPIALIKSNFRVNGGLSYSRKPGQVNELLNFANSSNFRVGVSLSSNISEKIDFNVSTNSRYNIIENTLRPNLNNNYYTQSTHLKYRWVFFDGFVYRADFRHQLNTGLSEGYDASSVLLNMSAGKKFLKDNLAEISINVYDLLQQNNNARRNITELYVEDRQTTVLQRYFMLTFTYNIRHFSPGTSLEDYEEI